MSIRQRHPNPSPPPPTSPNTSTTNPLLSTAQVLEEKLEHTLLVLWSDLPTWQRDNHYIVRGYRRASHSYIASLKSLGYLHNESVNIWTHLLGATAFVVTGVLVHKAVAARYETASRADVLAFASFFVGAVACLGMSAMYHALSNHSPRVARIGNKLDYAGIVVLIWGSFVASVYYGFFCYQGLRWLYWSMVRVSYLSIHMSILSICWLVSRGVCAHGGDCVDALYTPGLPELNGSTRSPSSA